MGVFVGGGSVGDNVGVAVIVAVAEGVAGMITLGLVFKAKYTMTAPIVRKKANKPNAAGRLSVISGIRLPCTAFAGRAGFSTLPSSAPHTRQRVASSLKRVPQVGQSLVVVEMDWFSGLIRFLIRMGETGFGDYTSLLSGRRIDKTDLFINDSLHGILLFRHA